MSLHFLRLPVSMILACLFLSFVSCSKDTDLLSDYISSEELAQIVNIEVIGLSSQSIIINPVDYGIDGNITQVTEPSNGSVVINSDNTMTYTPQSTETNTNESSTDEFNYTSESTQNTGSTSTSEGTVKVITTNDDVEYWRLRFDAEWVDNDNQVDYLDATAKAQSGNVDQEYYYLGYYVDGLMKIWQATGDNKYLDRSLELIDITVDDAVDVGGGYLGWPNKDNDGYALWDSFYWRYVATLLRIMYKSPNLRATGNYQAEYERLLAFTEKHIWERYESQGLNNFYRINTHMTSHWARIGMELFIITGKSKYKTVFENISFGKMIGRPSNLRNQFKPNAQVPSAYTWSQLWDSDKVQDTSHAGAIVSFIVTAYENGMYWNESDIEALTSTVKDVIWKDSYGSEFMKNVDGSGGFDLFGRLHDWLNLARYDQELQNKIKNEYTGMNLTFYGVQPLGIAALNARVLADGRPVYPEQ